MTSQEMMKSEANPGYWWVNKAALGEDPNWKQEPEPYREKPGMIFGYEEKAFLSRQYKTPNEKVSGAGTASAGLTGWQAKRKTE